jgi:hypothetical protein
MDFDKKNLDWLEYDLLKQYPHVIHGTFGRNGGVSAGHGAGPKGHEHHNRHAPEKRHDGTGQMHHKAREHCEVEPCHYASLNLSTGTSDHKDAVNTNREIVRTALGLPKILYPKHTHGVAVHRVTAKNQDIVPQADALYTTEKNIGLAATHADCQATIFYDPVHEAVGIVHCGWRGNVQNIYARLIDTMSREIGTKPHNLIVCVSPSLGPCCAEFVNYKQELPKEFWEFAVKGEPNHFDLWAISRWQLTKCGVLDKHIEFASDRVSERHPTGICSYCNADSYFSARRDKETSGRNATIVALKH